LRPYGLLLELECDTEIVLRRAEPHVGDDKRFETAMNDSERLSSSLTLLESVDHSAKMGDVLRRICTSFRLKHMTFLVVRAGAASPRYPYFCTTYPKTWTKAYLAENYFQIDPTIDVLRWSRRPVDWVMLGSNSSRQFFDDARVSGVGTSGMTIPLWGPAGERCLFSISSDLSGADWLALKADSMHELHIISHFLHEKVLSARDLAVLSERPSLSRRERQCLEQLANGFIPKQIAARLAISESAVRLYLGSARRKLGAKTSRHAVAKASFFEVSTI